MTPEEFAQAFAEISPPLGAQGAAIEANRCLFCFDAPCTAACPAHIDVPRFIKKIASGNLRGSALTILDANILGLSCARVCPVEVLCEGACVLHRYNQKPDCVNGGREVVDAVAEGNRAARGIVRYLGEVRSDHG